MRCTAVSQNTQIEAVRTSAMPGFVLPLSITPHAPKLSRMSDVAKQKFPTKADENSILADIFANGWDHGLSVNELKKPYSAEALQRLIGLGALDCKEEGGTMRYVLQPSGVRFSMVSHASKLVHDLVYKRQGQLEWTPANLKGLSKLELLAMACHAGFLPVEDMDADNIKLYRSSDRIVATNMLTRSKLYFASLLICDEAFQKGLKMLHHGGTHNYYACILGLDDFTTVNAVHDVPSTPDDTWKQILEGEAPPDVHLALLDMEGDPLLAVGDVEVPQPLVALPAPPMLPAPPLWMLPQSFSFPCMTVDGQETLTISLDGFSHATGRRRAYSKCIQPGHTNCFKYTTIDIWPEPWMSVAYILLYMRGGCDTLDKPEHQLMDFISDEEIQGVCDEMPATMLALHSDFV